MKPPIRLLRTLAGHSLRSAGTSGHVTTARVRQQLIIDRDERGVPWVRARTEGDLYFGLGYAMATDRLWQMDVLRRRAHGRLAEVLGPSLTGQDVLARTLSFTHAAGRSLEAMSPQAVHNLEAFAAGVDHLARRLTIRAALPVEFTLLRYRPGRWTAIDSVAIIKQLGFGLGRNLRQELFRDGLAAHHPHLAEAFMAPKYPQDGTTTLGRGRRHPGQESPTGTVEAMLPASSRAWLTGLLSGQGAGGSNGWVIGSRRSGTGGPMLANDPHIAFTQPNLWYQAGLSLGDQNAYGVTVPGIAGLVVGANRDIAWGITNATSDTQDLFTDTDDTHRPPEWSHHEVITVRGGPPVTLTASGGPGYVDLSRPGETSAGVGLYWSGFYASTEAESCQQMWRARSWRQFREALRGFGVPVLNFVFAAADGTTAFRTAGIMPRRQAGDTIGVSSRAEAERRWRTPLHFDELPESTGTSDSVYVSANHMIIPDGQPPYLGVDWGGPYRAQRIEDLIRDAGPPVTAADYGVWQMDTVNGRAARILPTLLAALAEQPPTHAPVSACHDILAGWDLRDEADQPAPLIFATFMRELTHRWAHAPIGRDLTVLMTDLTLQIDHLVLDEPARKRIGENVPLALIAGQALAAAVATLANSWGPNPERWHFGTVNRIKDSHPLAMAVPALRALFGESETPVSGGGQTVCLMYPREDGSVGEGAPWRFVVCFGTDGTTVQDSLRHGASGNPASAHYDDQTEAHAQGHLHTVPLRGPATPAARLIIRSRR